MSWHVGANIDDVPTGEVVAISVNGRALAIYNIAGNFYATDNVCTHAFALLSDGYMEGECIECPLHQAQFHIPTGEVRCAPAEKPLRTYPVKVDQGRLMIEVVEG